MVKTLILSILIISCWSNPVLASEGTPLAEAEDLPGLMMLILYWIIRLSGIIVLVVLLWGGFSYLTSAGSPMVMAKARKRMLQGVLGIMIVLASYALIGQIDPNILEGVFTVTRDDFTFRPGPAPPSPDVTVFPYQEMPFGTILETRILAKNISCFQNGSLVDCHSGQPVTEEETDHLRDLLSQNFKEIWPDPSRDNALIAYLCYDFDEEGDFLDGDPSRSGIQPIPHNDRLDCIERVTRALEVKSEELKDLTQELYELSARCACQNCGTCGTCCCGCETCCCGCNCSGEPCPDRKRMEQIQERLDMSGTLDGRNLLKEDELVQLSVDRFQDLTLVNQIRYLASRFLPPHIESLRVDLGYLEKVERMYKDECDYGTRLVLGALQQISDDLDKRSLLDTERIPFCLNREDPSWGEGRECPEEEQLDIKRWCYDYNCLDCQENGQKLGCGECKLDELKRGTPVVYPWGDGERTTYKCSSYRINQQKGETGRETEDDLGVICRIQTDGRECRSLGENPITFYCLSGEIEGPVLAREQELMEAPLIETSYQEGYMRSRIEIGQLTDNAQAYLRELMSELTVLVETSAPNVTCPSYDKDQPDNQCKLFNLPDRCQCDQGLMITSDSAGCGEGCHSVHGCLCNNCGSCPGCICDWCLVGGVQHPCPINIIEDQKNETRRWYQEHQDSVLKRAEQFWNLVLAENLQEHQPSRTEMLNQLKDALVKFEQQITGFGLSPGEAHTAQRAIDCSYLLDLQGLEGDRGLRFYPYLETCYPYNSRSPYGDNALSAEEIEACIEYRHRKECRDAVSDLMPDFYWFSEDI